MTTAASQIYVLFPKFFYWKIHSSCKSYFQKFLKLTNCCKCRAQTKPSPPLFPGPAKTSTEPESTNIRFISRNFWQTRFPDFSTNLNKIRGKLYIERKVKNNLVVNLIVSINYKNKKKIKTFLLKSILKCSRIFYFSKVSLQNVFSR